MSIATQGWVPYEARGVDGRRITRDHHDEIGTFEDLSWGDSPLTIPDFINGFSLWKAANGGKLPPFSWQSTGSCVGSASYHGGQIHAQAGDIVTRGDHEQFRLTFWLYSYGVGRFLGRMRSRGSGSYGSVQARAVKEYGLLPMGYGATPQPQYVAGGDWIKFPSQTELEWSYAPRFPISVADLKLESEKNQVQQTVRIRSTSQVRELLTSGFGVTIACSFGMRSKPRVTGDPQVLLAKWDGSWSHQQSNPAAFNHPGLGWIYWIQNQWGPKSHGRCPFMTAYDAKILGGYWVDESTYQRMIENGECYGHSDTEGFTPRVIDWGSMGMGR